MERLIPGPFADELKSRRDEYNRKFAVAQRLYPRISEDEFSFFLSGHVEPLVNELHKSLGGNTGTICESLYDFALEASGKRIFLKKPSLAEHWKELLAGFGDFFVRDPAGFPRTIANALFNLSLASPEAPAAWTGLMLSLKESAGNPHDLFNYGKAAAWRCGMAHFREDALPLLKGFGPGEQKKILGLPEEMSEEGLGDIITRIGRDPWFDPREYIEGNGEKSEVLDIVSVAGGFRGFHGHFISPPLVEAVNGALIAFDQNASYLIMSDVFGTTLSRINLSGEGFMDTRGEGTIDSSGNARFRGLAGCFPGLSSPASFASSDFTMAVTVSTSHSVFLIAGRSHGR